MKRLSLFILFTGIIAQAQNNLEFNQALIVQTIPGAVVPNGKVWKIESSSAGELYIDGASPPFFMSYHDNLPLWVPEGKQITSNDPSYISVLEFNLAPVSSSSAGVTSSNGGVSADGFSASGVFNVVLEGVAGNASISNVFGTIEVPEGKIWKVINVSAFKPSIVGVYSWIIISGNMARLSSDQVQMPNWNLYLSEGTHSIYCQSANNQHGIEQVTLNGIEYNAN